MAKWSTFESNSFDTFNYCTIFLVKFEHGLVQL